MKKYTHIFFDVDGTIMDSEKQAVQSFVQTLNQLGIPVPEKDKLTSVMGSSTKETIAKLGLDDPESAVDLWQKNALKAFANCKPFDNIIETVTALRERGYSIGIVSSRARIELENDISFNRFLPLFDIAVYSSDTEHIKPSPEPLLLAVKKAGIKPNFCVYVGDSRCDAESASAAGVDFILATWGARDKNIPSDYCITSPEDLLKILE